MKLTKKLHNAFIKILIRYIQFVSRNYARVLLLMLPITAIAGFYTFKLFSDIRTDIATLLPQQDVSVRQMRYIVDKVGGLGYLFVSVHSPDFETNKKTMEKIATKVAKLPADLISNYEYKTDELEKFFRKHGLYYMSVQDVKSLKKILERRMSDIRLEAAGSLLEAPDYKKSDAQIKKIVNKYDEDVMGKKFPHGYFASADGKDLAMVITPVGSTNDVEFSRRLISVFGEINNSVKQEFPSDAKLEIGISGVYVSLIENIINVVEDATTTALLTFALVFFALYLYYRNMRTLFVISVTVLTGVTIAFGISYFAIGYLNQLSVFLGAIIVGNGINFSIIQMSRYFEERRKYISVRRSILRSVVYTLSATGMAAFTASLAYGILSFTKFQGFSKFGVMGGIGMVVSWLISYLLIPSLSVFADKVRPLDPKRLQSKKRDRFFKWIANSIRRRNKVLTYSLFLVVPVSIVLSMVYLSVDRMEYQTTNLGNRNMGAYGTENYYGKRVEKVLGNGIAPALLYAKDRKSASAYASALKKEVEEQRMNHPNKREIIGDVRWIDEMIPTEQKQKFAVIQEMRKIFPKKYLNLLKGKNKKWGKEFSEMLYSSPVTVKNLPQVIRRMFTDLQGDIGRIFYLSPGKAVDVHNVHNLIEFTNALKKRLPIEDDTVRMASDSTIFSDIVVDVSHEGPIVTAIALALVLLLILLGSRSLRDFFIVSSFLGMGMFAFVAILLLVDMRLNFFNYVTIPITIGIGADYAINFYYRYRIEGRGRAYQTVVSTGSAVALCSLTTIIGYGTMIIANNLSLSSFGLMAIIGEFACVIFALYYLPAFLEYLDTRAGYVKK